MNGNPAEYEVTQARTLPEALAHLAGGFRPLAGGTDLMVLFEAGRLPYRKLVSVRQVPDLLNIEVADTSVTIGAAVTYSEIRAHTLLQQEFHLLCQTASWTGGIANQNRGTLGGNIVNASPAADSPPALLVYDAELELVSLRGARWVSYDSFHTGYKAMRIEPDELLTRIRCPRVEAKRIEYSRKVGARKAQAISKVAIAAMAIMDGDRVHSIRIALASVAPVPLRCRNTEQMLTGVRLSPEVRKQALATLAAEVAPIADIRSTAEYRLRVSLNLLTEFLDLLQTSSTLAAWNIRDVASAVEEVRTCCASTQWVQQMASRRPFASRNQVFDAADEIWAKLATDDRLEAFRAHPRIGDRPPSHSLAAQEQSGMNSAGESLRHAMIAANQEYEARFGYTYIVRASGRGGQEMLERLERRLANPPDLELEEASEQQRQIMQLRLRKWLGA